MKILGTGLSGLIGSRVVDLLGPSYSFQNISRSTGVDITSFQEVLSAVRASDAEYILHLAAFTDVKKAEHEKDLKEKSEAWKVNVIGTENIAKASAQCNKKIIYISTDLVFNGEHAPQGGYTEADVPDPLNWYAQTKYEGELRVTTHAKDWAILRVAYPYRAEFLKLDFVRLFLQKLDNHEPLTVLSDRIITPTFIDTIANALDGVIKKNAQGIFHAVGSESLSIHDCAIKIADIFGLDASLITETTRASFLEGKPVEPFNSSLNNGKITELGVTMLGFSQGLVEVKKQLELLK